MEVAIDQDISFRLVYQVIQEAYLAGVREFCLGSGARNMPFLAALKEQKELTLYHWYEERSAAFFALGRTRATKRPVAVITTSGTAVGELLPAAMEAYYTQDPLLLITADRPRILRGTGAPQTCEQPGIFGVHALYLQDVEGEEKACLQNWSKRGPAHLNVCLDEPLPADFSAFPKLSSMPYKKEPLKFDAIFVKKELSAFLHRAEKPIVVVGALPKEAKEGVVRFLLQLNAPVYLEGLSLLREHPKLQPLRIFSPPKSPDAVLRLGGIPTCRFWRDVEQKKGEIPVLSLDEKPFKGLSFGEHHVVCLENFFNQDFNLPRFEVQQEDNTRLQTLLKQEPLSEPGLVHGLSKIIPEKARVYLGNSLPIREWDLAATDQDKNFYMGASRGLNGIDGQLSTFLGWTLKGEENWGIFGDLTMLYDLAACWILPKLQDRNIRIVVINNGGGKLFSRIFPKHLEMQNPHRLDFSNIAAHWNIPYHLWHKISEEKIQEKHAFIEIVPNPIATQNFWHVF